MFMEIVGFGIAGHGIAFLCVGGVSIHSSEIKVPSCAYRYYNSRRRLLQGLGMC